MKKIIYLWCYIIGFIIIAYIQGLYVNLGVVNTKDFFLNKSYFILATFVLGIIII